MTYALVAALAFYIARNLAEAAGPRYVERYTIRARHAMAWSLVAAALMVLAVLNP